MKINVTKDKVSIIEKDIVHVGEYNINHIEFEFSAEYTADLVKNAVFTNNLGKSYQTSVLNNECYIPAEILSHAGSVIFGVYAYKIVDEKLELRYSPFPTSFVIISGSYDSTAEEGQEITPSQFEQYMQAMNDGLNKVEESIKKMDEATSSATQLVDDINQKLENGDFIGPEGQQGVQGTPGEKGDKGDTGVGITTITAGTPVIEDDKTVTSITFNKTDGSNQTVNVEAQNGETQDLSGYVTNDVLDNIVPKNTSNGETVSVNDAIAYKAFDFEVDGASEQVTTTGKNLLNYTNIKTSVNNLTNNLNDDGSITTIGTPNSNYSQIINSGNMIDLLEDGETYTIMQMNPTNKLYLQMTIQSNNGSLTYVALNNNTKNTLTFTVDKSSNNSYSIVIETNTIEVTGDIDIGNYYQL